MQINKSQRRQTKWSILLLLLAGIQHGCAQDPMRFREEVAELVAARKISPGQNTIVFTGSSSIRLWNDLEQRFPQRSIINTGFGGSHMADLLYWAHDLIVPYKPSKVFIYEGDNDLADGTSASSVLTDASKLVTIIHNDIHPDTKIYFLTPKPSIARWHLKETYEDYIVQLKAWASTRANVTVIDVWSPLLDKTGSPDKALFLEDNLHINSMGYDLWFKVIAPHVNGNE